LPSNKIIVVVIAYILFIYTANLFGVYMEYKNFAIVWFTVSFIVLIQGLQMQLSAFLQRKRSIWALLINYISIIVVLASLTVLVESLLNLLVLILLGNSLLLISNSRSVKKRIL